MNNMPLALRNQLAVDPEYKTCLRNVLLRDHTCSADPVTFKLIEWEHAIIFASKQVQLRWAIVPICWYVHRGPGLVKEINVWLALNRASDEELMQISKAVNFIRERKRLNDIYGKSRH